MHKTLKATALALALITFGSTAVWAKGGGGGRSVSSARPPSYSRPAPAVAPRPAPARPAAAEPARKSNSDTSSSGSSWFGNGSLFGRGSNHRSGSESAYCPDGSRKDRSKPKGMECQR